MYLRLLRLVLALLEYGANDGFGDIGLNILVGCAGGREGLGRRCKGRRLDGIEFVESCGTLGRTR